MFTELNLKNFRNFDSVQIELTPQLNIFLGNNGQGKTNLIEALNILSTGNSFRFSENENLIRFGSTESLIRAKIFRGTFDYEAEINILKSKKNIYLQGKKITSAYLNKLFPVIIFSPESLSAIKDGADERRQLIDDFLTIFSDSNIELILEFRKCLKARNKILKIISEDQSIEKTHRDVLESLNISFLKLATEVTWQRISALNALVPEFNAAMKIISNKSNVDISVEYVISGENSTNLTREEIEICLNKRLNDLSGAEISVGSSLVGPQKHDIKVLYGENDSRFYCSQGQQRALILSFKLAQIVYHRKVHGTYPVLMLDDVLSELDSEKRGALISFLTKIDTQIFITTTDLSLPTDIGKDLCSVIHVTGGKIHDDRAHKQLWSGFDSSP